VFLKQFLVARKIKTFLEPDSLIKEIVLTNPYNEREFVSDKLTVVDVKATDENKCHYQIEIQLALHPALSARMLYTWSSLNHSQIKKGDDFDKLKPVISIWILTENLFDNVDEVHLQFVLYNLKNKLVLNEDIEIHLLQLPKWQKQQIKTEMERWIYLFKEGKNVDVDEPPEVLCTDEMRQAMETLDRFSENVDNYLLYQNRLEATLLENTYLHGIEKLKREKEQAIQREEQAMQREEQERREKEQLQAKLDSLLLQLKEKGMDDVVAKIS